MNQTESPASQSNTRPTGVSRRTKIALWLMIAPTALIIVVFMLFAILNFVFYTPAAAPAEGELFTESPSSLFTTISNVILFVVGAISVTTFLPGLITGIVLLATRK